MKKLLGTIVTTAVVGLPFAVVACSSNNESIVAEFNYDQSIVAEFNYDQASKTIKSGNWNFQSQDWSMDKIDWSKIPHVDARIVHWIDGDTPHVSFLTPFLSYSTNDDVGIRISGIDTPELHVQGSDGKINVLTKGNEFKWADEGRIFGDQQMPVGTTVRIATTGDKTYNRVAGSIFYGDDFQKNYSVEIMKKGLCYPFLGDQVGEVTHENSIMHYIALPIADAFNKAKKDKLGIFSPSAGDVSVIHGSTDVSKVLWDNHTQLTGNIYNIIEKWSLFNK